MAPGTSSSVSKPPSSCSTLRVPSSPSISISATGPAAPHATSTPVSSRPAPRSSTVTGPSAEPSTARTARNVSTPVPPVTASRPALSIARPPATSSPLPAAKLDDAEVRIGRAVGQQADEHDVEVLAAGRIDVGRPEDPQPPVGQHRDVGPVRVLARP